MKEKNLEEMVLDIKKRYGQDMVNDAADKAYEVVSTGSYNLDKATGIGGFARGKFVELFAWEGVGKSTIALHVIANAQAQGLTCALVDSECALDKKYASNIGVDTNKLIILTPNTVEDASNVIIDMVESGKVQVVILDSMSALVTQKELEGEVGDNSMGVKARLVGQFCRRVKRPLDKFNVLFLSIGQLRDKITAYGDPTTTDYGNAMKFFADIRIQLYKSMEKDGEQVVGNRVRAKILKNKMAEPFKAAEFLITFGIGIDSFVEIVENAVEKGIVTRSGSWYSYGEIKIGQGITKVLELLQDNPELFSEIKQKLIESDDISN